MTKVLKSSEMGWHAPVYFKWVSCGYSGFLLKTKDIHVRLIGDSKLAVDVRFLNCVIKV